MRLGGYEAGRLEGWEAMRLGGYEAWGLEGWEAMRLGGEEVIRFPRFLALCPYRFIKPPKFFPNFSYPCLVLLYSLSDKYPNR